MFEDLSGALVLNTILISDGNFFLQVWEHPVRKSHLEWTATENVVTKCNVGEKEIVHFSF